MLQEIRGLLLDIEGVLSVDGNPISGAVETVKKLTTSGFNVRYLTNNSTQPLNAIYRKLSELGFELEIDQVFSPVIAARNYQKEKGISKICLATDISLKEDFERFSFDGISPDLTIMVGDDIFSDIAGAKRNHIKSIQVRTGKYQQTDEASSILQPDYRIDTIGDLASLLEQKEDDHKIELRKVHNV